MHHQNKNGRQLRRHPGERHAERVRSYRGTASYDEKALRKRKVWVEALFAEAKDWHGMRRLRLRTLRRVNAEALLVAAGQNLKRFCAPLRGAEAEETGPGSGPAPAGPSTCGVPGDDIVRGGLEVGRSPFCNTLHRLREGRCRRFEP